MIRLNPPKKRPRQQPFRKGEAELKYQYSRDEALARIQLEEALAALKRAEAANNSSFNHSANTIMSAMELLSNETPFTGQEYSQAAEDLRQQKVEKWHDINKGFEAAIMAQLGADLGVPLIKGGLKWLKNKAVSRAAKTMMNPENFTFEGPLIKPAKLNITEEPIASEPFGSIAQTLFTKPRLSLPQPKLRLGLPTYNTKGNLDIAPQDAGLYNITDGDLAGIRLVNTALKPKISISPHSLSPDFMEHHTGNSVNSVVDNIYNVWNQNYPLWELEGIKPPLPFIASIGDDVMSVGFRPQWYKMIETPRNLERMTAFAGPTRNKLIANLSPEAKLAEESRRMAPVDLFDEWLGPEARSPQQIAIDDEVNAFNKSWEDRLLFDTNVNSLYQNGLITPRHRQALINSDEPLKYFNGAAQHNIMKKATQQYFKDIKLAKQKDYARRVMLARKEESLVNAGLNDRVNAVYRDLQGTVLPPSSLNRQIADAENAVGKIRSIGDIVEDTFNNYKAWKDDPNPAGWQLKYLMQGNKLEKQLSKDGNISINAINDLVKNGSDIEKYVTKKVLDEKFAGQSKVNYSDFKHAVQDELVTYRTQQSHAWENYGINKLGYDLDEYVHGSITFGDLERAFPGRFVTTRDPLFKITDTETGKVLQSQEDLDEYVDLLNNRNNVLLDTYTFSSPRIPKGNMNHYQMNTLGHSRTFVSKEEPEVMHVMESQSDWGQKGRNTGHYETDMNPYGNETNPLTPHEKYLMKNWESRLIQENMIHAANKGLTKMRYPTEETAAKIEGYSKTAHTEEYQKLLDERDRLIIRNSQILDETGKDDPQLRRQIDDLQDKIWNYSENYADYPKQHKTILRKYSEFPKKFKKIYKDQEVREVTDANGNTWYEVDVPKNMRKRERAYSITGTAIAGGTAATTLKPLKRDK